MKLYGHKIGLGYYINSTIICYNPFIDYNITFRIDTGCDMTTINPYDHRYFGLDFKNLGGSIPSISADGNISQNYIINALGIYFQLHKSIHAEFLDRISICVPDITEKNRNSILSVPSLLGLDILKRYTIKFEENYVVLEK